MKTIIRALAGSVSRTLSYPSQEVAVNVKQGVKAAKNADLKELNSNERIQVMCDQIDSLSGNDRQQFIAQSEDALAWAIYLSGLKEPSE